MPVSTEEVRRLLLSQPPREIAAVLKEWRADQRFSQAEAAVHLGVPVRTLQEGFTRALAPALPWTFAESTPRFQLVATATCWP
jgi:hypothetical protein